MHLHRPAFLFLSTNKCCLSGKSVQSAIVRLFRLNTGRNVT